MFAISGTGSATPITFFDFNATIGVGSTVDFVLGRDGSSFGADESILSAFITLQPQAVPEPSTVTLILAALVGLAWFGRRRLHRS